MSLTYLENSLGCLLFWVNSLLVAVCVGVVLALTSGTRIEAEDLPWWIWPAWLSGALLLSYLELIVGSYCIGWVKRKPRSRSRDEL